MCGIVGVFHQDGMPVPGNLLKQMTDVIAHRGPDGEGHYLDGPVGLGHRRLAIVDLSSHGRQPMANETGDVIVTFNGEIYNFRQLRSELETHGHLFLSQTDTEVIVHAYEQWGDECVLHFNGMFAFAILDRARRRLFLARDRYGIKPLYWYHRDGVLVFASEIKAILKHPRARTTVCYPALAEYFTFQNIFTDLTLFEGVRLLPPAATLSLVLDRAGRPAIRCYWDYPFPPAAAAIDEEETVEQVCKLFETAVGRQLMGDVPIGAYLSGGMDSGSITCVAARNVNRLTTFTCGFDLSSVSGLELGCDERRSAEILANRFKTEHYEVVMHSGDMEWVLPGLVWHLEDLRVGQSYPNYYVARLASKFVKVVLSGVGGDELFGGYPWRYYPGLESSSPDDYFRRSYRFWQRLVADEDHHQFFNAATYRQLRSHSTFDVFRDVYRSFPGRLGVREDYLNASLYFELKTFLHGILVVEDKLSMAHSLESRVPFLDDDLVEFACRLPARCKLRSLESPVRLDENRIGSKQRLEQKTNQGKAVLRAAMARFIPAEITERTKQGFTAPDGCWFRGESIDYIGRLLQNPRANIYEFINPAYVKRVLEQHWSGQVNRRLLIWSLLCFEWWLAHFGGNQPGQADASSGGRAPALAVSRM
jgi:asparagine synthase (glutamine-hydrolysing)